MAKYKKSNETFTNPYAFVSIEDKPNRSRYSKGNLTGWIEIELIPQSHIFIPNTTNDNTFPNNNESKSYDFFSYVDNSQRSNPQPPKPVIPGSEIRGVIKNAFETLTNSCFTNIDDDLVLSKRTTISGTPCVVKYEDNKWKLYKAIRYGIAFKNTHQDQNNFTNDIGSLSEMQPIWFHVGGQYRTKKGFAAFDFIDDIRTTNQQGYKRGYFHKGEYFPRKHHESVFEIYDESYNVLNERDIMRYIQVLKEYKKDHPQRDNRHNKYCHLKDDIHSLETDGFCAYFNEYNSTYYLSPSAIGREVFKNKLRDIVHGYSSCISKNNVCNTCKLFGFVNNNEAIAGRIRFEDARPETYSNLNDIYESPLFIKELASPKLSATEFYLKKPMKADLWNFDYAIKWKRNKIGRVTMSNEDIKEYKPDINGRKFYWHQITNIERIRETNPTKRNVKIRPIKPNCLSFTGKIYFNQLEEKELKKLLWSIDFGGKDENAHKIGMGKPLGLGSISIGIKSIKLRNLRNDKTIEYSVNDRVIDYKDMTYKDLGCSEKVFNEYMIITNFKQKPNNVQYPNNSDSDKTYEWFSANRSVNGTGVSPVISQIIPEISEKAELNKYCAGNNNKKSQGDSKKANLAKKYRRKNN